MDQILIAWIGGAYIDASLKKQHGSISATLQCGQYSHAYLSYNFSLDQTATYIDWLKQHKKAKQYLQVTPATPVIPTY